MADGKQPMELRERTKQLALRVIRVGRALKRRDLETHVMRGQLVKAGTSVGAHYREACRARSGAEFRSKMNGGLQELDESAYWLEVLVDSGTVPQKKLGPLMKEVDELIAIFVRIIMNSQDREE